MVILIHKYVPIIHQNQPNALYIERQTDIDIDIDIDIDRQTDRERVREVLASMPRFPAGNAEGGI